MIAFGLRLTLRGGREAVTRLLLIAGAVTVGVGLLLTTLAGLNAVNTQNARYGWLETGTPGARPGPVSGDPVWWSLTADQFQGQQIGRVDVAATGPDSPVPPGIPALPGPGEFYASPAMSRLLAGTPRAELAARYPGKQIGTIGDVALPAPNSLIIIVGRPVDQLADMPGVKRVTSISTTPPSSCNGDCVLVGINAHGIDLVLSVITAALLFPVLIFIATATRLSAARREQRFAALRLVGATPRQITVISTVESTAAAAIGVAGGFGFFFVLRPVIAPLPFTGAPFFVSDLTLSTLDVLLVAIGVPIGAAIAARAALRRVTISPLGVSRRVTPAPPRAWRVIPLLAGLAELAYFVAAGRPGTTNGQILAFLPGILLTMTGLVLAGPWLTMLGVRAIVRRAARPASLIAARRMADDPQSRFRAVSGLVLALFVTSVAIGVITTMTIDGSVARTTSADRGTILADFHRRDPAGPPSISVPSVSTTLLDELRATPGVDAIVLVHQGPADANDPIRPGLVSCAQLATVPALGRCTPGAETASIRPDQVGSSFAPSAWPAANAEASALPSLPVETIAIATNGSATAIEQARTLLENADPLSISPTTIAEQQGLDRKRIAAYQQLADVVIIATLPIAGCTLAVSVVAGLNERRRPFSLLRLTGAPLPMLRRIVLLESVAPLIVAAVVSIATGFVAAALFLRSQLSETLHAPNAEYYGVVVGGLLASFAIIGSTLPMLRRITGPEAARND